MSATTVPVAGAANYEQRKAQGLVTPPSLSMRDCIDDLISTAPKVVQQEKASSIIPVATLHRNARDRERSNTRQFGCRPRSGARAATCSRRAA